MSQSVLDRTPADADRPSVTYRAAGDGYLLIEYGDMVLDLRLNFLVIAIAGALAKAPVDGVVEAAPGLRSILVNFDPDRTSTGRLIAAFAKLHEQVPGGAGLTLPSRLIRLPIAFDDSASGEAVARYLTTIRGDAPNARGGTNIDYIVDYNGLPGRQALYEAIEATEWWNAFTGFFPGLPFMFPVDPRFELVVPKYNPTRTWTAEGAVGIGGPCVAIYPVESPGGYQLFGRTLPIYDIARRNAVFRTDPILIRPGDRVVFSRVTEEKLLEQRARVLADRYEYQIEDAPFPVGDYLALVERTSDEAARRRESRDEAAARTEVP